MTWALDNAPDTLKDPEPLKSKVKEILKEEGGAFYDEHGDKVPGVAYVKGEASLTVKPEAVTELPGELHVVGGDDRYSVGEK